MGMIQVGVVNREVILVLDATNTPVIGLVRANFGIAMSVNGVDVATAVVAITEIDAVDNPGEYLVAFTPAVVGDVVLIVRHVLYEPGGFRSDYEVVTEITPGGGGVSTAPKIKATNSQPDVVEVDIYGCPGYTYRATLTGTLQEDSQTRVGGGVIRLTPASAGSKTIVVVGINGAGNAITRTASVTVTVPSA